ncbi:MAG: MotB family protein [Rhizobiaceae bacterium]|nr:MotB family protein [Rhizobiaceae bacterium]
MSKDEDGRHQEIIIVRRGGGDDEEGHHGGAWKIAFADFMTAMMCFFLVMWLINAANEQSKESIASYFNPVKLIDHNTNRKGIDDLGKGPQTSDSQAESEMVTENPIGERRSLTGPADNPNSQDMSETRKYSDEHMFADPYAVLAEIAADVADKQNISAMGDGGASEAGPSNGASGGEAYRDPFAPNFWSTQIEAPDDNQTTERSVPEGEVAEQTPEKPVRNGSDAPDDPASEEQLAVNPFDGPPPSGDNPPEVRVAELPPLAADQAETRATADAEPRDGEKPLPQQQADVAEAPQHSEELRQLADQIRSELAKAFGGAEKLEGITVSETEASVSISVADDIKAGMFEIGSAVPRRDLVLAMEKIGKTLAQHAGSVSINGHTDGRPYKGDYDNWRLSTARAHATYYMLVRGGLAEDRIRSVTGYADRRLKLPDDPYAAVNRRIEILLGAG